MIIRILRLELVDLALCELLYLAAQLLLQKFFLSNLMFLSYSDLALVASLPQPFRFYTDWLSCMLNGRKEYRYGFYDLFSSGNSLYGSNSSWI